MSSKEKKPYQDKNAEEVKKFEKLMKDYKEVRTACRLALTILYYINESKEYLSV